MSEDSSDTGSVSILDTACDIVRVIPIRLFPVHAIEKRPMPGYMWDQRATDRINFIVEDFTAAIQLWGEDQVSIAWAIGLDNCMAIDIDVPDSAWPPFIADLIDDAVINRTARGTHLYFRNPKGVQPGNGASNLPDSRGIDVRGAGGYVVIDGPDRPGLDPTALNTLQPFPHPAWLVPYGGLGLHVSDQQVLDFVNRHNGPVTSEPSWKGVLNMTDPTRWDASQNGTTAGRHTTCLGRMTKFAEEAQMGLYSFYEALVLLRVWWEAVMEGETGRDIKGEFKQMTPWAVGRALSKAPNPTSDEPQDERAPGSLPDSTTPSLIQFRELPSPFELPAVEWHAKGLLMQTTHGELGGPEKSMKSYLALTTTIAIALGVPVLGRFEVPERQRVLMLSGEGGEVGMLRRVERITAAYGADIDDLRPWLRYTTMTAPLTSSLMQRSIEAAVDEFDPAIVWLDPWYAYAPGSAVASSALLTDIGQVLSGWRSAVGMGRTAMINHHLNTGGTGSGLQRLAGAGHAEWCDSWMLVDHRTPPDVDGGRFRLKLRVGSRQWGGGDYAIDLNVGHFDAEHGIHMGAMSWNVSRLAEATAEADDERHQSTMSEAQLAIKRYLRKQQRPVGRNELIEGVGGNKARMRAALDILIERGEVIERALKVAGAAGRPKIVCSLAEDQP